MASLHEETIKTLRLKREIFKYELQAFRKMLEVYELDAQPRELQSRQAELEAEYAVFAKEQPALDLADENGTYARERLELKYEYIRYLARAQVLLQSLPRQSRIQIE